MGDPRTRTTSTQTRTLKQVSLFVATLFLLAGCATSTPEVDPAPQCVGEVVPDVDLIVAGTGSALPLVERIVETHSLHGNESRVWVPGSIGSRGALAALRAGDIDIGLLSREPREGELLTGSELRVFAFAVVAFHAHTGLPQHRLSMADVQRMYEGEIREWPDGTPVVLLVRERGDSSMLTVEEALPDVYAAMETAQAEGRAVTIYTDQDMLAALIRTPGAVGLLDRGLAVQGPPVLRPVPVNGLAPDSTTIRRGVWPLLKPVYMILEPNASPETHDFADYIQRYATQEDIARFGYAPTSGSSR